jgi:hypothetical protein
MRLSAVSAGALIVLPLMVLPILVVEAVMYGRAMTDVHQLYASASAVTSGHSPYIPSNLRLVAARGGYAYPPLAATLFAPLTFVSLKPFEAVYALLQIAVLAGALAVLGVRDWRCYAAALAAGSTGAAVMSGNISFLLVPALALAWRYRDRALVAGPAIGVAVGLKVFLWPLFFWLLATRRFRAAFVAGGAAAASVVLSWWVVGFAELTSYPRLLGEIEGVWERRGYSPTALMIALGLGDTEARAFALLLAGLLVVAMFRLRKGDWRAFVLALAASLVASPIVWTHYFVILLVPIAVTRPRFAPLWLVPIGFWALPVRSDGHLGLIAAGTLMAVVVLSAAYEVSAKRTIFAPMNGIRA